ncbi:MAG TPA: AAA domain-containing protein, partial [Spirochaetota bacterium]|nr:AAA domain-containing protein [Spirochaetota bacterium]
MPFSKGDILILDQSINNIYSAVNKVLQKFKYFPQKQKICSDFLTGKLQINKSPVAEKLAERIAVFFQLNKDQKKAFKDAVSNTPVAAVQGPPGTGKTFLLAALVCYFTACGQHVFITALSHFAINNALNKCAAFLKKIGSDIPVIKISRNKNRGLDRKVHIIDKVRNIPSFLKKECFVIGATVYKARTDFNRGTDCVLIMDEASQISLPLGIMSMYFGSRYIFIGDHKQLAPITNYNYHPPALKRSLFEHITVYYGDRVAFLSITYRMNKALTAIPSLFFYENRLKPDHSSAHSRLEITHGEDDIYDRVISAQQPSVFAAVDHSYCGNYSVYEALFTAMLIYKAVSVYRIKADEVAVLTPFRAQQELVRSLLHKLQH